MLCDPQALTTPDYLSPEGDILYSTSVEDLNTIFSSFMVLLDLRCLKLRLQTLEH